MASGNTHDPLSPLLFAGLLRLAESPASAQAVLHTLREAAAELPADDAEALETLRQAAERFVRDSGEMSRRTMLRLESLYQKALSNKSLLLAARIALYQAKATRAFESGRGPESLADAIKRAGAWYRDFGDPAEWGFSDGEGI